MKLAASRIARALVASALFFGAPDAVAAEPLARALQGEAHDAYDAGRALFKSGDYAGALARFEQAYAATPDPRLLWNMAACERKLGHDARVLSLVSRYLVDGGALLSDDDRQEAERFVTAVRARVAVLSVTTDPPGAHVRVDGASAGDTPLSVPIFLDPGTHHIEVTKDGYQSMARDETIAAGERRSVALGLLVAKPPEAPPETTETPPSAGGLAIAPPPSQPKPPPPEPEPPSRLPAILVGGAGVVSIGIGAGLVIAASSRYSTLQGQCAPSCDRSAWHGSATREAVGDVLIGVGAAAVVGGVVLWVTSTPQDKSSVAVVVAPSGALVRGAW